MNAPLSSLKSLLTTQGKVITLLAAMLFGAMLPQLHVFSPWIQYLLMVMLFFSFLDIKFSPQTFQKSILGIVLANIAIAFIVYAVFLRFNLWLALAAFMTACAPTAIAAPVITGFVKGKVEYVVTAVVITNIVNAVIVPLALPSLLGTDIHISVQEVLLPVLIVMFVPLLLAQLTTRLPANAQELIHKGKPIIFPVWLVNLLIISANASDYLRTTNTSLIPDLLPIALVSMMICIINFGVGALLGGHHYRQEASQSLGQKNLSFVIWIALTFINPLVAMGPTFYVLFHHLYNSWMIYQFEKERLRV